MSKQSGNPKIIAICLSFFVFCACNLSYYSQQQTKTSKIKFSQLLYDDVHYIDPVLFQTLVNNYFYSVSLSLNYTVTATLKFSTDKDVYIGLLYAYPKNKQNLININSATIEQMRKQGLSLYRLAKIPKGETLIRLVNQTQNVLNPFYPLYYRVIIYPDLTNYKSKFLPGINNIDLEISFYFTENLN